MRRDQTTLREKSDLLLSADYSCADNNQNGHPTTYSFINPSHRLDDSVSRHPNSDHDFLSIFNHHYTELLRHTMTLTGDMELSKDILHDIFIKYWQNREALHEVRDIGAYLYIITRNHCYNILKKQGVHRRIMAEMGNRGENFYDLSSQLEKRELDCLLQEAIESLPRQRKKIFCLAFAGRTRNEIALVLGLSPNTIKNAIKSAKCDVIDFVRKKMDLEPRARLKKVKLWLAQEISRVA